MKWVKAHIENMTYPKNIKTWKEFQNVENKITIL
jgi:hypothetical protein